MVKKQTKKAKVRAVGPFAEIGGCLDTESFTENIEDVGFDGVFFETKLDLGKYHGERMNIVMDKEFLHVEFSGITAKYPLKYVTFEMSNEELD